MKVYGNIEGLKQKIKENYENMALEIEKEETREIELIEEETNEKIRELTAQAEIEKEALALTAKARVLNEEKLKAKRKFEGEREKIIQSVFLEIEKDKKKIAESNEYIKFVKTELPKKEKLIAKGGSPKYKKDFKKIKIDKKIAGMVFSSEETIYDFTIESLVAGKEERIREKAIKELFGE
jgi:vacuolar-type H+-ATPase subunit E/Vma4